MAILNFGFNKIHVEKKGKTTKQINIKSGLHILNVASSDVIKDVKQKAFGITFKFIVDYEPEVGVIELEGELLYLANPEVADKIQASWDKDKSLPKDVGMVVFNRILQNCNVEALILSREINLPAPLQLPKIQAQPTAAAVKKNVPK